jgi:2-deoxy-D-gluconate 3-dehydrogenase
MPNKIDLTNRFAVVTGGAQGIGRAITERFLDSGATVAIWDRDKAFAEKTGAELKNRGNAIAIACDVTKLADVERARDDTVKAFGRIDILVNNAGIIRRSEAIDFSEADWDAVMNVNLKSAFFLTQAVGRRMLAARRGKIINIASLLSFQGGIRVASYTASKSGIAGLTRLLANEWAGKGVNVNAIAPGYFATNNTQALRSDENRNREILARIPAGRWGQPQEVGGAAVFLAAPASDYVHGAVIPVDGGWLAR